MPLVSVIIPVYNTESFLPKCIDSVLAQTLSNIEILLINDGSTDNCGIICDNYARKDNRVQVMHTLNRGTSHARNKGLEIAKGEYISFLDSDDWIDSNMLATLYQLIQRDHTDLSTCGYNIENKNGNIIYAIKDIKAGILNKWEAIHSLFQDKYYRYKGNLWDKLYDKKIIDYNQLRFNENIYYNEDRLFIFQYLSYCESVSYTTIPYYHYIIRNSSAMSSFENTFNRKSYSFMDAFDIMTSLAVTYPKHIKQILSIDYIKSSYSFFKKNSPNISFTFLLTRIKRILLYNYRYLPFSQKIKYALYYTKIIVVTLYKHL